MGANPSRERMHLNQEYMERNAAGQSMFSGNYQAAALHQNRADWAAYQADQVHYKRYQKGRTFAPYAVHPGAQPFSGTFGQPVTAPTYSALPYNHMGSGAVYPGYSGPTVYNPVGTVVNTVPYTTQVPISSQTYDLCLPTTALAPVPAVTPTVFPQVAGYGSAVYPNAGFF